MMMVEYDASPQNNAVGDTQLNEIVDDARAYLGRAMPPQNQIR